MKIAYIFPGQGAQYVGMGKLFYEAFSEAKHRINEAEDLLHLPLKKWMFEGPESELKLTKYSQLALYVTSMAILDVLTKSFALPSPIATGGLSLGEYSALTAAEKLSFQEGVRLVQKRALLMHEACETTKGTMAVVLGMDDQSVRDIVSSMNLPNDLWCANFNCPGQVVISGTIQGIEKAKALLLEKGAKRVLPLEVHGAFHSGLMLSAQEELAHAISQTHFMESAIPVAMNVTGDLATQLDEIQPLLVKQLTSSVLWSNCVRALDSLSPSLFLEIGPGSTLQGMNKRIGPKAQTISIEKPEQLDQLTALLA